MDLLHTAFAFFFVFGLLGSLYFYAKRGRKGRVRSRLDLGALFTAKFQRTTSTLPPEIEVLRRLNLTATHQIHLIATDWGKFLLCTHTQGCSLVSSSPAKEHALSDSFPLPHLTCPAVGDSVRAN